MEANDKNDNLVLIKAKITVQYKFDNALCIELLPTY